MKSSEGAPRMPFMSWTKEMSVGVAVLDDDHMRLVELLNELHRGVMAGKTRAALEKVIEQLVDYTRYHFKREETLFTQAGFPGAEEHRHEHEMLLRRALSLQARFENGQSRELSLEALDFLQQWLSGHILGSDREYIPYLHAKGIH
jgi:hemerythrin